MGYRAFGIRHQLHEAQDHVHTRLGIPVEQGRVTVDAHAKATLQDGGILGHMVVVLLGLLAHA